jgi:hypothetical protein
MYQLGVWLLFVYELVDLENGHHAAGFVYLTMNQLLNDHQHIKVYG